MLERKIAKWRELLLQLESSKSHSDEVRYEIDRTRTKVRHLKGQQPTERRDEIAGECSLTYSVPVSGL